MKKIKYREGQEASENFERLAMAVFRAPRVVNPKKQPKQKAAKRRTTSGGNAARTAPSCPVPAAEWWSESASLPVSWA